MPRAGVRSAALDPLRVEPFKWKAPLAGIASYWPILRRLLAKACAHGYRKRSKGFLSWRFSLGLAASPSLRTQFCFAFMTHRCVLLEVWR
jgi:hypothetical protein